MQLTEKYVYSMAKDLPIIKVGACYLQHLVNGASKIGYTSGVYGWDADVYDAGKCFIVMGYRPFGTVSAPYELCKGYDKAAESVCCTETDYDTMRIRLKNIMNDFVGDALALSRKEMNQNADADHQRDRHRHPAGTGSTAPAGVAADRCRKA